MGKKNHGRNRKRQTKSRIFWGSGSSFAPRILKVLSEGPLGFADLKRSLNVESSGHIQFHLDKLDGLIKTDEYGKYCISDKGKDALLTMQPIEKYNEDARFREQAGLLIRALRSDLKSVQEIAIAQLSLFGPKVIPFLTSALLEALAESKSLEGKNSHSYYNGNENLADAPERAVTGLVVVLGIIGVPSVVPDIASTLPRTEAFEALAKIGNKQALDAVVSQIPSWFDKNIHYKKYGAMGGHYGEKDEDYSDVVSVAKVEGFLTKIFNSFDEEGRIALETALNDENFEGKNVLSHNNVIARVLAVVGDDKSIPALTIALEKGNFATKTEAARALNGLKAVEVMPKVINELLKTANSLTKARNERGYWANEDHPAKKACEVLANTVLSLGSTDDWITVAFHRPRIEGYAEPFDEAIVNAKDKAVPALTKLLEAPDSSVQSAAAEMIAKIKRGNNNNQTSNSQSRGWERV